MRVAVWSKALIPVLFAWLVLAASVSGGAGWDPARFAGESTLQFLTVGPDEGEHWTTVWLVVLDGEVYVRLGSRAAERITKNTRAPLVKVRLAGRELDAVRAEAAPEMVERVAAAMGDKYWSDLLIRYTPHPLTMRLVPVDAS